jgi:hypothetical protein
MIEEVSIPTFSARLRACSKKLGSDMVVFLS